MGFSPDSSDVDDANFGAGAAVVTLLRLIFQNCKAWHSEPVLQLIRKVKKIQKRL